MKLTKQKVLDFHKGLILVSRLSGAKFSYAVAKNLSIIAPEVELLGKMATPSEEFIKYDDERATVAKTFAEKNEDGSPKSINNTYIIKDEGALAKALEPIKAKHIKAIEARDKQLKDFEETLKEEMDIDIYKLNEIFLPESITPDQVTGILIMLEEKSVN